MSEEVSGALPSLISLMVSVDIKQYLYVLSRLVEVGRERRQIGTRKFGVGKFDI